MRGSARVPDHCAYASSSACSTSWRAGQRSQIPRAHELAHDRQAEEHLGEHVVVRAAGRRLGVVFGEAQTARFGDEERVEPRDRARRRESRDRRAPARAPSRSRRNCASSASSASAARAPCETRAARRRRAAGESDTATATESAAAAPSRADGRRRTARARAAASSSCRCDSAARLVGEQRVIFVDAVAKHR